MVVGLSVGGCGVCEAVRRYIMHTPGKILEIA